MTDAVGVNILISQDPAGTTPERTGCLCAVCNSVNSSDRSAQQGIALWRAGIQRDTDNDGGAGFLATHYWTNAVMHGAADGQLEAARFSCSGVLRDQIAAAGPRVVIAGGRAAAESLFELGLLKQPWSRFRGALRRTAYREDATLQTGAPTAVFVTYHASARSVNQTVSGLYGDDVELLLERSLSSLPSAGEARRFLGRHDRSSTPGCGMRVLLLHWLEIGAAIRAAHGVAA